MPRLTPLGAAAGDEGERRHGDERGVRAEAEERRERAGERERRSSERGRGGAGSAHDGTRGWRPGADGER